MNASKDCQDSRKKKKPNSQGSMGTGREEQTHQAQRAMIHSEHNEEMKNEKRSTQNVIIHSIRVDACLTCGPRGKERWKKKNHLATQNSLFSRNVETHKESCN